MYLVVAGGLGTSREDRAMFMQSVSPPVLYQDVMQDAHIRLYTQARRTARWTCTSEAQIIEDLHIGQAY